MREADFSEFASMMDDISALMGRQPMSTKQSAMMFRALARYSLTDVRNALDAHMRDPQRGRFYPLPADLIGKIEESSNTHPGSDEAWAIAVRALDEAETVVWTNQMAEAWGLCKSVMDMGDEVGARMAFRQAYDRLVSDARQANLPAVWIISEGFDKERRIVAVQKAESAGLLLPSAAREALPLLEHHGAQIGPMPDNIRQKFAELRQAIINRDKGPSFYEMARQETERRKAEAAAKVDQYTQSQYGRVRSEIRKSEALAKLDDLKREIKADLESRADDDL